MYEIKLPKIKEPIKYYYRGFPTKLDEDILKLLKSGFNYIYKNKKNKKSLFKKNKIESKNYELVCDFTPLKDRLKEKGINYKKIDFEELKQMIINREI